MRVAYQSDMGETMFEVNREGAETLICIANSLSQDEILGCAGLALTPDERAGFSQVSLQSLSG